MGKYILTIDQSTSGTKALIINEGGDIVDRQDLPHKQIISQEGYISHDASEIYKNVIQVCKNVIESSKIDKDNILGIGISNQRETAMIWDKKTGEPIDKAVVWQCSRASKICEKIKEKASVIKSKTGLQLSPYFSAGKIAWLLENNSTIGKKVAAGTMDSWIVFKLTGEHKTDFSNASRTQMLNLFSLTWDMEICRFFNIPIDILPKVCFSDEIFGYTNLQGILNKEVPICGVLGDSHAALFGQGCTEKGMIKATYGTGSSVMVNCGELPVLPKEGLVASLAWGKNKKVNYVIEGNINYSGSVITWLKDNLKLIENSKESGKIASLADPEDTTYLVPAFTGLGAPYFKENAQAIIYGMTRQTGNNEIVKAAEESMAYQIVDIINFIKESGFNIIELRADGGPTKDEYLMQFQSDILDFKIAVSAREEVSALGAAYMAGISIGMWDENILNREKRIYYNPNMPAEIRNRKYTGWRKAVNACI